MLNNDKMWNIRWAKDTINGIIGQDFLFEPINSDTINEIGNKFQGQIDTKGMDMPFSFALENEDMLVKLYNEVDFKVSLKPKWDVRLDGNKKR